MTDGPDEVNEFRPYGQAQAVAAELGQVPARLDEYELSVFTRPLLWHDVSLSLARDAPDWSCSASPCGSCTRFGRDSYFHRCGEEGVVR